MNKELKNTLKAERELYIPHIKTFKNRIAASYTHIEEYVIYRFICALRRAEFYRGRNKLLYLYWIRITNLRGERLGFSVPAGVLGKGVRIYHIGSLIINSQSIIGDQCIFHGDNCIGNNGKDNICPVLGKRVDLGVGAKVIGNVVLADDIVVGANAVVTKSFLTPGITIAGVPARKISVSVKMND